jgi:hypothetical protein
MLCWLRPTAEFTATIIQPYLFVLFNEFHGGRKAAAEESVFPAFSPFSQKRPTAAALQTQIVPQTNAEN